MTIKTLNLRFFPLLFDNDISSLEFIEQEYRDIAEITIEDAISRKEELIERFQADMDFYGCIREGLLYSERGHIVGIYEDFLNLEYYMVAESVLCWLEKRSFKNPPAIVYYS